MSARRVSATSSEDAAGWLELARWARANDFDQGAEKAALVAARLDPDLPALEPLMAGLGYQLDDKTHEWIPYADAMRRQGLVEDRGEWVTPDEKRERSQHASKPSRTSRRRAPTTISTRRSTSWPRR